MTLLATITYTLLTSTLSGALGMAGGVILLAIYMIFLPLPQALILHGLTAASGCAFRALINYKKVRFDVAIPYIIASVITFGIFHFISFKVSKQVIFLILGFLPFLSLLRKFAGELDIEKRGRAYFCGFIVSCCQTISGVAGGLLDLFFLASKLDRFEIVATKAFTQMVGQVLKTIFFIQLYHYNFSELHSSYYIAAAVTPLFGSLLGKEILKKFSDNIFMKVAKTTMFGFSGFMVYKGFALVLV